LHVQGHGGAYITEPRIRSANEHPYPVGHGIDLEYKPVMV
jgi:hypothetical protein